jgi:hypothetical protein
MTEKKLADGVRDLTRAVKAGDKEACCDCLKDLLEDYSAGHATGVMAAGSTPALDAACADLEACCKPQPQATNAPAAGPPAAGVGGFSPDDLATIWAAVQMVIRWWKGG